MVDCEWEESSVFGMGDLERLVLNISCLKSDILFISSFFRVSRSGFEAKLVLLRQLSVCVHWSTFDHILGKTLNRALPERIQTVHIFQ